MERENSEGYICTFCMDKIPLFQRVREEPLNLHHSYPLPLMRLCFSLYKTGIYKMGASNRLRINGKVSEEGRREGWQAQSHYHSVKGLCSASVWQLFSLLQPLASELLFQYPGLNVLLGLPSTGHSTGNHALHTEMREGPQERQWEGMGELAVQVHETSEIPRNSS